MKAMSFIFVLFLFAFLFQSGLLNLLRLFKSSTKVCIRLKNNFKNFLEKEKMIFFCFINY